MDGEMLEEHATPPEVVMGIVTQEIDMRVMEVTQAIVIGRADRWSMTIAARR